jgi:hypothetical protein
MTIGFSIFLIALGAILKFAVTYTLAGIDLQVVGVILMICGVLGLILGLVLMANGNKQPPQPPAPPAPPQY